MYCIVLYCNTDVENADLGKGVKRFPLLADVVLVADDDDVLELAEVVVASAQRHDKVAQPDQRRLGLGEQADDHVVTQHRLRRLITVLTTQRRREGRQGWSVSGTGEGHGPSHN